jgi:hypothetical protein
VSPSSERARQGDSSSEETSSDEEESSLLSSSPNVHRFFDVVVEFASSSTYLCLFSEEAIGVAARLNLFCYKCQHYSLYGVTGETPDEARVTVQWRGAKLELPVAAGNDYVSIVCR